MLITYPCANSSLGVLDGVLLLSVNVDKAHRIRHPIAVTKSEKVMSTDTNTNRFLPWLKLSCFQNVNLKKQCESEEPNASLVTKHTRTWKSYFVFGSNFFVQSVVAALLLLPRGDSIFQSNSTITTTGTSRPAAPRLIQMRRTVRCLTSLLRSVLFYGGSGVTINNKARTKHNHTKTAKS